MIFLPPPSYGGGVGRGPRKASFFVLIAPAKALK